MTSDKLRQHFERVASSDSGIEIFKWLMDALGYHQPVIVLDPQAREINTQATAHNATLRDFWLEVRKLLPLDALIQIEHGKIQNTVKVEGEDNARSTSTANIPTASNASSSGRFKRSDIESESRRVAVEYLAELGFKVSD